MLKKTGNNFKLWTATLNFELWTLNSLILATIILIGAFLRFYNLNWGNDFYFHPDEGNMGRSVAQLRPEEGLHPHFFAYGQFPLYLAYFSNSLTNTATTALLKAKLLISPKLQPIFPTASSLEPQTASFNEAIYWLRFWSAIASTLTIYVVYKISKYLSPNSPNHPNASYFPILAALFAAFTPGLIQAAHFGTTEALLAFFFMLILYLCLKISEKLYSDRHIFFPILAAAIVSGLALGTKLSAVYFLAAPLLAIFLLRFKARISNLYVLASLLLFSVFTFLFFIFSSPYSILESQEFRRISTYETEIATGKIQIFYTRQFIDTVPLLFQATKIFPYTLGWPIFVLGMLGFFSILFSKSQAPSTKQKVLNLRFRIWNLFGNWNLEIGILLFAFLAYLLPNSLLFAKWVRFMTPIFPFFAIFTAYLLYRIYKNHPSIAYVLGVPAVLITLFQGLVTSAVYAQPDIRIAASNWIYANIPDGSYILSETGNVVDMPVASKGVSFRTYNVVSFDFYHLDSSPELQSQLVNHLVEADYILVPSRRIFANHTRLPQQFPISTNYYNALFADALGFELIHEETPFSQFRISNFEFRISDERSEETWSVFDHPVVRVFKKTKHFDKEYYENILKYENIKKD